jgi:hypothetical protein
MYIVHKYILLYYIKHSLQFPHYCNHFSQNTENLQYTALWVDKYKNTAWEQTVHSELLGTELSIRNIKNIAFTTP